MRLLACAAALLVACGSADVATPDDAGGDTAASDADAPESGPVRWARSGGDGNSQFGYGVAVDASGNVFAVGEFGGAIDLGAGALDNPKGSVVSGFVAKFDRSGRALWSRRLGSTTEAAAYAVAVDAAGHAYVVGYFKGELDALGTKLVSAGETDAFLVELDPDGKLVFAQRWGDSGSQVLNTVVVAADGTIALGGDFDGTIDFGGGPLVTAGLADVFVATLDRDKKHVLSKRWGGPDKDRRPRVAFAPDGGLWVTASYRGVIDVGGGPLPDRYDGAFLLRLEKSGAHRASKGFDGDGWQFPTGLSVSPSGALALSSRFTRTVVIDGQKLESASGEDALLAVFGDDGKLAWAERYGGFNQDAISGLAWDPRGDLWITGELLEKLGPLTSAGASDAFVARLDAKGTWLWSLRFGDGGDQRGTKVAADPLGGAVVVGSFFGAIDLPGGFHLASSGGFDPSGGDVFLASFR